MRIPNFSLSFNIRKYSCFEPKIILKLQGFTKVGEMQMDLEEIWKIYDVTKLLV